jgi:hypothetical protein
MVLIQFSKSQRRHCCGPSLRAKRSNPSRSTKKEWIASSRSLSSGAHSRDPLVPRNDGDTLPHSRGAIRPSYTRIVRPKNRGRGECRVPGAPAASCAHGVVKMHTSIHSEVAEITRHSRTQWFTAYFVLSPAIGLSCHRRPWSNLHELDASVEASGPHVFAVRFNALVRSTSTSTASRPASVTIASRPSGGTRRR